MDGDSQIDSSFSSSIFLDYYISEKNSYMRGNDKNPNERRNKIIESKMAIYEAKPREKYLNILEKYHDT